ncbi:immunity protein Imm33 domain-containing protein [Motiliproteus sediminis]|uniref:immunity protein Imm33 domain-containing protein n=1 Tax=Motiliproteus sediminis TaxID=1468178 RepID=UPI001AEF73BE|nr:DUF2185 domain-containing protein [Motiliproteus sediminis]
MSDQPTIAADELERPFLALVSKLVVGEKPCPVRFMYRTVPANLRDTGWRMYSGYEDQDFLADSKNMQPYPTATLIQMDNSLDELLGSKPGTVWERVPGDAWQEVHDFEIPVEEDVSTSVTNDVDTLNPADNQVIK